MKAELLASFDALAAQIESLRDQVTQYIPDDPLTPTGLFIVGQVGTNPLDIFIGWDDMDGSVLTPHLQVKGTDDNPAGPQEWTECAASASKDGNGGNSTYVLQNPDGQKLLFRLGVSRIPDGVQSPWSDSIPFPPPQPEE